MKTEDAQHPINVTHMAIMDLLEAEPDLKANDALIALMASFIAVCIRAGLGPDKTVDTLADAFEACTKNAVLVGCGKPHCKNCRDRVEH